MTPKHPLPTTFRTLCSLTLLAVLALGGCVTSASSRWAQNAPTISPTRSVEIIQLGARADANAVRDDRADDPTS